MDNNQPHPAVIEAIARKAQRLSTEVEKIARYGREWLPDDNLLKLLWRASGDLFAFSKQLQQ